MVDPLGLAPWDVVGDVWDATGGRVVSWVAENPGTAATAVGVGVCLVSTLGACGGAAATAWAIRSAERAHRDGFRESLTTNLVDAGLTYATFGLVSTPASLGLTRGGGEAVRGLLRTGEKGIMAEAPAWQHGVARTLATTPDVAALWWSESRLAAKDC